MNDNGWSFDDGGKCCPVGLTTIDVCSSFSATVAAGAGWVEINDTDGYTIAAVYAPAGVDLGTVTVELRPR